MYDFGAAAHTEKLSMPIGEFRSLIRARADDGGQPAAPGATAGAAAEEEEEKEVTIS